MIREIRQSTQAELLELCRGLQYSPHTDLKGLTGIDGNGRIAAVIGFDGWTYGAVCLHSWIRDKSALSREFLREVCLYPYRSGRKVLVGNTPANNAEALRFNKHYGFKEVHRIRDGYAPGVDLVIQELRLDESCRWTKPRVNAPASRSVHEESRPHDQSGNGSPERSPTADDCRREPATHNDGRTSDGGTTATGHNPASIGDEHRPSATDADSGTNRPEDAAAAVGATAEPSSDGPSNTDANCVNAARRWYSPDAARDECVSPEPRCDIEAQLDDLFRPGSKRLAVYLSPANVRLHAEWSRIDPRIGMTYLLPEADGISLLYFRSWNDLNIVEDRLWNKKEDLRRVIGEAVMAGSGKPEFSDGACVVQLLTESGAVCRESIQPSEQAAQAKLAEWADCPGTGKIMSLQDALARRQRLVA